MGTNASLVNILGVIAAIWLIGLGVAWMFGPGARRSYVRGTGRILRSTFFGLGRAASNAIFHALGASRRRFPRGTAAFFAIIVIIILYWWLNSR